MYNHYVPDANGIYRRFEIEEPFPPQEKKDSSLPIPAEIRPSKRKSFLPNDLDAGDLLILLILLLLMLDGGEEDHTTILIILACFLFL